MQYFAFILALLVGSITAKAQELTSSNNDVASITVHIENIKNNDGTLLFALHNEKTFMKGDGIQNAHSKIENGKVVVTFENVAAGEYAILVLHDENDNKQMDFEPNGMPKEDYGVSNNNMSYGPPQFSTAKFTVNSEDLEMKIKL